MTQKINRIKKTKSKEGDKEGRVRKGMMMMMITGTNKIEIKKKQESQEK